MLHSVSPDDVRTPTVETVGCYSFYVVQLLFRKTCFIDIGNDPECVLIIDFFQDAIG
jgi:hypothetical protein